MGKLFVVGIGPGDRACMTGHAQAALNAADVLCGYDTYIDLIRDLYPAKEIYTTPMRRELDRCRTALELVSAGRTVALVCGGDAGVYGMAAPVLELAEAYPEADIEVVPGVTAALAGAAALGAPLGHDFCVLSLSDLLTPWDIIQRRLRAAAAGDFALCLYNPASSRRPDHLHRACDILLDAGKSPDTACGWVRNIGRDGEERRILPLGALRQEAVDMFTTVFIGSSSTFVQGEKLITPRGYGL